MLTPSELERRARKLRLVSFDVDGVLTDGKLYYGDDGRELKAFNVQDGASLKLMQAHGLTIAILTGRRSSMVERRARELGIEHLYQGLDDKREALDDLLAKLGLDREEVAHVGDDLPDLALFDGLGLTVSVPNGHPTVQRKAHLVTAASGGQGVARELAERLLRARDSWPYD